MLRIGIDSYVSVEDADQYMNDYYAARPEIRNKWMTLDTAAKESLLRDSTRSIDKGFKFRGRKVHVAQQLQFPRVNSNFVNFGCELGYVNPLYDSSLVDGDMRGNDGGLRAAREATVENAVGCMLYSGQQQQVMANGILGITSKKIGSISESYNTQYTMDSKAAKFGIYNYQKITHLLIGWVSGNYLSI